jgi:membrane dipeptidase
MYYFSRVTRGSLDAGMAHTRPFSYQRLDAHAMATRAGVSEEAVGLLEDTDVIDLHLETYIPPRLFGYDLFKRHRLGPFAGRFFGHLDFPRVLDSRLTGAMWSIATNVARTRRGKLDAIRTNVDSLGQLVSRTNDQFRIVRTHSEYEQARQQGAHGVLLAVQGGNAFEEAADGVDCIPGRLITRVTLVHLSNSVYGATSSPLGLRLDAGLTPRGRDLIAQLNSSRTFVDLAHISRQGFWEAVDAHDSTQPLLVTHTGVDGVRPSWRNIDDEQIRAVADTGGVIGIIFHSGFLRRPGGPRDGHMVIEHLEHVIRIGGERAVAVGSDYDGLILPPRDLRDGALAYVRLVQYMLDLGWPDTRIRAVLGQNFLAAFRGLRP